MPDARPPRMTAAAAVRLDSKIENSMNGMGIPGIDVAESNQRRSRRFTTDEARQVYRASFAARREIDNPARDLVARGVEFIDMPAWVNQDAVRAAMADVGAEGMLPEDMGVLQALSLLYGTQMKLGGALGVLIVEDGLEPWEPLDLSRVERLLAIEVLERDEVTPYSPTGNLARPEFYVLSSTRGGVGSISTIIHRSRVLVGVGDRLGPREEALNQGWGASRLELLADERTNMHVGYQELGSLLLKSNIDVLAIAELSEQLCPPLPGEDDTRSDVDARLALIARSRGQHKIIPIDAGRTGTAEEPGRPSDSFTNHARATRGAQDLAEALELHWAAGTGQTPSIALGKNLGAGLNSGENAGDWATYGVLIDGIQTVWLDPRFRYVMTVLFSSREGPTRGRIPAGWRSEWPPLAQPSSLEEAQTAAAWAGVDTTYVGINALPVDAITAQRFEQGVTGMLTLEPAPILDPDDPDAEPLEGEPVEEEEELDEVELAWSDAQPPADAGTSSELAALDELAGKVTAHGITRMARNGEIVAYRDLRRGKAVAVYSLRNVKEALLVRAEPPDETEELELEVEDDAPSSRSDRSFRARLTSWLRGQR